MDHGLKLWRRDLRSQGVAASPSRADPRERRRTLHQPGQATDWAFCNNSAVSQVSPACNGEGTDVAARESVQTAPVFS